MPNDFLGRLFNKVTWIFRSEEQIKQDKREEAERMRSEVEKRASRERKREVVVRMARERSV